MAEFGQLINNPVPVPPTNSGVTVPFVELDPKDGGSPIISVEGDGGGTRVERTFKVAYGNVTGFCIQALGQSLITNSTGGPYVPGVGLTPKLSRRLPMMDPEYFWLPAVRVLRAKGMNWVGGKKTLTPPPAAPTGTVQSILNYDQGAVTLEFAEVDYNILDDATVAGDTDNGEFLRYVTLTTDSSVDYISIPTKDNTIFLWAEGPHSTAGGAAQAGSVPDCPGRPLPGQSLHWRWRRVPYPYAPHGAIRATLGRVNKYQFAKCDPGTLLMVAKDQELKKGPDGAWLLDMIYAVRFLEKGWNRVINWLSDPIDFYAITAGGVTYTPGSMANGKCIFDEADFAKLFRLEA